MAAEDRERDQARSDNAKQKRKEQLKRWLGSDTEREPERPRTKHVRVKFDEGAVFLAACSSGDQDEVEKLLLKGADINYTNVDGLTALHQACIDENLNMVTFLLEHGANVNQPDNEGWTALHAAASCGFMEITQYLIKQRANVAAVNSEGELPIDIAQGEAMEKMLKEVIKKQGIDVEVARKEEEQRMIQDARQWLNRGKLEDVRHPKTGASALHVAAAKGYLEVMKLLIQAGFDVNSRDNDGWTPLHAASHWGKEEICRLLVENLCNMQAVNKVGQTAFDVADESLLDLLEELQKKQTVLRIEKEKQAKMEASLIELSNASQQIPTRTRRTSISRMSSKDKISMHDKERKTLESVMLEHVNDDEEDRKKLNGSSSEEEMPHEVESVAEKAKVRLNMNNLTKRSMTTDSILSSTTASNKRVSINISLPCVSFLIARNTTALIGCTVNTALLLLPSDPKSWRQGLRKTGIVLVPQRGQKAAFSGSPAKAATHEEEKKEQQSPAAWRTALRKTGSYGTLNNLQPPQEEQKGKEMGIVRSASSPKLTLAESKEKEKEPRLARVPPTPTRKLFTIGDANEDKSSDSAAPLARSASYTRQREDDSGILARSSSYTRRQTELESNKRDKDLNDTLPSSTGVSTAAVPGHPKSHLRLKAIGRSYSAQDFRLRSRTMPPSSHNDTNSDTASSSITTFLSASFGRRQEGLASSSAPGSVSTLSNTSSSSNPPGGRGLTAGISATSSGDSYTSRSQTQNQAGNGAEKESNPTTQGTGYGTENRERRRSYLTPVRDEEAEAQRKARSRHARQSRRSTQGVTLTDLQEAEKTIGIQREKKAAEQEKEKEKEEKEGETKDFASKYKYSRSSQDEEKNWRSRLANLQKADLLGLTSYSTDSNRSNVPTYTCHNAVQPLDNKELEKAKEEEKESDDSSFRRSGTRDRRRPRGKRRSTGVHSLSQDDENDQDQSDSEDVVGLQKKQTDNLSSYREDTTARSQGNQSNRGVSYSDTSLRSARPGRAESETDRQGYRKLYEELQRENVQLQDQLQEMQMQISHTKLELEKATQMQERFADRTAHLEMEKKVRAESLRKKNLRT
ncbi:protein phosphatase 1 regulatory subunit 12A isoform X2 [Pristis pectinata]|uniref:protein phosphatase 1 regulatory subunit 12A isoform X2 n=1 Tax=Pristis pectinata TaxID=685728 RepID=UPI00223D78BD|nr:protein phosphatase 1 regulatory subunit 12A isoform X2 [Pristis pectinata]